VEGETSWMTSDFLPYLARLETHVHATALCVETLLKYTIRSHFTRPCPLCESLIHKNLLQPYAYILHFEPFSTPAGVAALYRRPLPRSCIASRARAQSLCSLSGQAR
jgi:hypothetical protein